jgi:tetratricopeptide (TPR) repeat protein
MKALQFKDFRAGDAWLVLRLDAQVQDKSVDVYMTMDLPNGRIMAFQTIDSDMAEERHAKRLLEESFARKGQWPKRILLAKGDPVEGPLRANAAAHNVQIECVPQSQLEELIAPVKKSYGQQVFSPSSIPYGLGDDLDEMDRESARQLIPETYDPCWCASGKKFKFCCKPIFRDIACAVTYAEEGRKDEALKHIAEAKRIVGETAEVLCREATVWARFDKVTSAATLERALAVNPDHPRANYIRGIDLKTKGDFSGAIEAYSRAIASYPKTDRYHLNETYNNLGNAFFESGETMKAKAAWEQALLLMPSDKTVRRNLIECVYENPKLSAAERAVSPFVEKIFNKQR